MERKAKKIYSKIKKKIVERLFQQIIILLHYNYLPSLKYIAGDSQKN